MKRALAASVDREAIFELITLYGRSSDIIRERIENLFRAIESPVAVDTLIEIVSSNDNTVDDPLTAAALEALSKYNSRPAVNAVLRRFDNTRTSDAIDALFWTVASISSSEARTALENAALGRKEIALDITRVAAIYALANYPGEKTSELLGELASEKNPVVSQAAASVLASMSHTGSVR